MSRHHGGLCEGFYDGLNDIDPVTLESESIKVGINMDAVAAAIVKSNYGTHRFLWALIRLRKSSPERHCEHSDHNRDVLVDTIEDLLLKGYYQ